METDKIYNEDCIRGLERIPDKSIDLIVMDPPYEMETAGGGAFGPSNKQYHGELTQISKGISNDVLEKLCGKMKAINIYIWCNKNQLRQYIDYFEDMGCNIDLLTWHKTNPVPTCNNKYLSDTEYCVFAREEGVKVYGSYETKHKFYVSSLNTADKDKYGHPTIKPLNIIKNLIINSSRGGDLVLDPFIGSGTTAVACKLLGRHYLGFEIDPEYHQTAIKRVNEAETVGWF
ncbi:MAG: site-specific DNA-methyltransferase [Clostridiales bacterium]|nr:site-specific DNA-methyltransferase [Clostridiales bacterium]MBQ1573843.1 site-specific DNA-methyltransferase [Clostridiales bacterium]